MIKKALLLISLTTTLFSFAQKDSIYYFKGNFAPATKKTAAQYNVLKNISEKSFILTTHNKRDKKWWKINEEKIKIINDSVLEIKQYKNDKLEATVTRKFTKSKDNLYNYTTFDDKGNIIEKGKTETKIPLKKNGEITSYYSSGIIKEIANYKDGIFISNKKFTRTGEQYTENICPLPDKYPKITHGMSSTLAKHFLKTFNYPEAAETAGIVDRVYISFTLTENLNITDVIVIKSKHKIFDDEVIKTVKLFKPKGKPAILNGKSVSIAYVIPMTFNMQIKNNPNK